MDTFLKQIDQILTTGGTEATVLADVLDRVLERFDCAVGTIHRFQGDSKKLELCAERGLPPELLPIVGCIPIGKGMAGLAAERRAPVQVCNLQEDASGDVRPGAKLTRMEGSVAIPILVDDDLRGVLGVAKPIVYEFTDSEVAELSRIAVAIGRRFV